MAQFFPMKGTLSTAKTARVLVKKLIRLNGFPSNIISDQEVQFTSRFWKALCEALGIMLSVYSAYYLQTIDYPIFPLAEGEKS